MSLTTPESIRRLQRKLYVKAKVECRRVSSRGTAQFPGESVFGELGLQRLRSLAYGDSPCAWTGGPVGEPDAANPHVRFDERDLETE
jgi:hypothetical protein